jgi:hypothetical protein
MIRLVVARPRAPPRAHCSLCRNKRHHFADLPSEARRELGPTPASFFGYFAERFPRLFIAVYRVFAKFVEVGPAAQPASAAAGSVTPCIQAELKASVSSHTSRRSALASHLFAFFEVAGARRGAAHTLM